MSPPSPYIHQPGEGEQRWMGPTSTYFLATGEQTGGALALVDEQAMQGEEVPLHVHGEDVESFYVLEGEMAFYLGEQPPVRAGAGAFVHVPAGAIHGFRIQSERARSLILTTARHGDFYRAITRPSSEETVSGTQIEEAAREYGIELVGPLPDA